MNFIMIPLITKRDVSIAKTAWIRLNLIHSVDPHPKKTYVKNIIN